MNPLQCRRQRAVGKKGEVREKGCPMESQVGKTKKKKPKSKQVGVKPRINQSTNYQIPTRERTKTISGRALKKNETTRVRTPPLRQHFLTGTGKGWQGGHGEGGRRREVETSNSTVGGSGRTNIGSMSRRGKKKGRRMTGEA